MYIWTASNLVLLLWISYCRLSSSSSFFFFFSSRRRHTRFDCDWSSDVCSSDLYGRTVLQALPGSTLLADLPLEQDVWMSHFDAIMAAPPGFRVTARTQEAPVAALEDPERRVYGVQFHPEVAHTPRGQEVLQHFLYDACGCRPTFTRTSIIETAVEAVREQVGGEKVICGLSGGVDSAVAAALVHKAVADQLTCVYVDTGLMRMGEAEQVEETFRRQFNVDLVHVKAADRFIEALDDVIDPERKRKAIGETFIRVFEEVARDFKGGPGGHPCDRDADRKSVV